VNVGRHLGLFTARKRVEHSGSGEGPIPAKGGQEHTGTVSHQPDPAAFQSFMDAVLAAEARPVPDNDNGQPKESGTADG
jgi:hypothetical protein